MFGITESPSSIYTFFALIALNLPWDKAWIFLCLALNTLEIICMEFFNTHMKLDYYHFQSTAPFIA